MAQVPVLQLVNSTLGKFSQVSFSFRLAQPPQSATLFSDVSQPVVSSESQLAKPNSQPPI